MLRETNSRSHVMKLCTCSLLSCSMFLVALRHKFKNTQGDYLIGTADQFEDVDLWMWFPVVCQ